MSSQAATQVPGMIGAEASGAAESPAVSDSDSKPVNLLVAARLAGGAGAALAAAFVADLRLGSTVQYLLAALALTLLPVDALPVLAILSFRYQVPVVGLLSVSDVVLLAYLIRLAVSGRLLRVRVMPSQIAFALFLAWAAGVTIVGVGVLSALGRIALYAAAGVGITHRAEARRYLIGGVVGLASFEVICYMPSFGDRLYGVVVGDPAQLGYLCVIAALLVLGSQRPLIGRLALGLPLLVGVAASMTRVIWFALSVVAIATCLPKRWYAPIVLPPAVAAIAAPLIPMITHLFGLNRDSGGIRQRSFEAGLTAFRDRPITGHGWAFTSKLVQAGYVGVVNISAYNVWIYVAASTGLVGVLLFGAFVTLLSREVVGHRTAYLTTLTFLAIGLTEMPLYAGSLIAMLFFTATTLYPSDVMTQSKLSRSFGPFRVSHRNR